MYRETHMRAVAKTISYRFWGTGLMVAVVYMMTGKPDLAFAFGGFDLTAKLAIFFAHERAWDRIQFGRKPLRPFVLWFTGLSGSGKTTLSKEVADRLKQQGYKVEHIDGDLVRDLFPISGFTREERMEHLRRVALLVKYLEKNGVVVVASFISPYEESRQQLRGLCENYVEVFISTPLEECEKRDVKGLYKRARSGLIKNFTGIDEPYETPKQPELTIDTSKVGLQDSVGRVLEYVRRFS